MPALLSANLYARLSAHVGESEWILSGLAKIVNTKALH
jgi:hypothetical protein